MEKKFIRVGQLKEGNYLLIDGFVCQIREFEKSKPGKHGAARARITGIGVFDNQKRTLLKPTVQDAEVPVVDKGTAQVVAVMGNTIQIMDTTSYEAFNADKPKDIEGLQSGVEVEYIRVDQNVKIVRKK